MVVADLILLQNAPTFIIYFLLCYILKRNAKAFSLNDIVDVRLRRHEMIVFNLSETIATSKFTTM